MRFTLFTLGALLLLPAIVLADNSGQPVQRRLTVSGEYVLKLDPTLAHVSIGVITQARSSQAAAKENAAQATQIEQAVKAAGIAEADIQTSDFSISPVYSYPTGKPAELTGYQVNNTITVCERKLPELGSLLDAVIKAGSNNINGITFGIADEKAQKLKALAMAVKEARIKAEVMASAAGEKITDIYEMNDNSIQVQPGPMFRMALDSAGSSQPTPIAAGQISVSAAVTIVYQIEKVS